MPLPIGDASPTRVYAGDDALSRIYCGDALIWSAGLNASDDFNRPDLGANWLTSGTVVPFISDGRLVAGNTTINNQNNPQRVIWAVPAMTDNFRVRATVRDVVGGLPGGLILRASADFQSMVVARMSTATSGTYQRGILSTVNGGSTWTLRAAATTSFVDGDVAEFRVRDSQYTFVENPDTANTLVVGWNDSGNAFPPSELRRHGGLLLWSDRNFLGTQNYSNDFDDFQIADLV